MKNSIKRILGTAIKYLFVFLILFSSLWLFAYIFSSSFKPFSEIMSTPKFFPQEFILDNYAMLLTSTAPTRNFPLFIFNSLKISLTTALLTCVISSFSAYGFARNTYRGGKLLQQMLLFTYVFPTIILLVPMYKIYSNLNLLDNYWGLIIIQTAITAPFCTWILISFFKRIPRQIEEAAAMDGASRLQTFWKVLIPISAPGIITAATYAFITSWGEYMFSSILIRTNIKKTITLGIVDFTAEQSIEWGRLLASSTIVILPVILLFIPISINFIKGFTAGSVKE